MACGGGRADRGRPATAPPHAGVGQAETARAGRQLAQAAVQLHGGMGMTDELEVGDYFKRLTVADQLLGDSAEQLAVLGAGAGGGGT